MNTFQRTVSALAYSLARHFESAPSGGVPDCYNDVVRFVLRQQSQMPDYLRWPMRWLTICFGCSGILCGAKLFHRLSSERREQVIRWWQAAPLSLFRDFIRFYQTLIVLGVKDREGLARALADQGKDEGLPSFSINTPRRDRCEIAVIGSGPGGAITACLLAEAGRGVTLFEEGAHRQLDPCRPFSVEEMLQKYREGGITVALGASKIAYVEGRCVGGGSEINSGLYHRTPPEILEKWRKEFAVDGLIETDLLPHFATCEHDLSVGLMRGPAPAASLKLHEGATRLGWKSLEVPRCLAYEGRRTGEGAAVGRRQSMTETYLPRASQAGCDLQPRTRVTRLRRDGNGWGIEGMDAAGRRVSRQADTVFVCAGAVQTPALLLRSGFDVNIGRSLQLHPTVKIIAEFAEQVNFRDMGVPVHQVKEFAPLISFGCSISSPSFLGVGMLDHPEHISSVLANWENAAVYYAMISPAGTGAVQTLPGFRSPLVRYRLMPSDYGALGEGLRRLALLLLEAGAVRLYPSLRGGLRLRSRKDLDRLPGALEAAGASLMTIHLFSSCPMGEDRRRCAVNSFGAMPGVKGLYVNDASLLCTAPGVNPQGSIMALARRNALKFLGKI
jgi:choline dehydrogenase-like flavoprotein